MKKILLSLAVAISASLGASALNRLPLMSNPDFQFVAALQTPEKQITKAPSRAEESATPSMEYNLAGKVAGATAPNGTTTGSRIALAVQMSANDASRFAGNKITEVSFHTGVRQSNTTEMNYVIDYTIFVTNELKDTIGLTRKAFEASRKAFAKQTVQLDNPITIEAGKSYYFGVIFTMRSAKDLGLVVDGLDHGNDIDGGWCGIYDAKKKDFTWDNFSEYIGFNCISATVEGETLPENGAVVSEVGVAPTIFTDSPFTVAAIVTNNASNPIENLEFTVTVGDNEPVSKTFALDKPVKYGEQTTVSLSNLQYSKPDAVIIKSEVTKVNGVANTTFENAIETEVQFFLPGTAYPTTVVAEEFTGTWCGWCPFGLYNMDLMQEKYPDSFILVAVHSGDNMQASTFASLLNTNKNGYPFAYYNRMYGYTPQEIEVAEYYYNLIHNGTLAAGKVSAECSLSEDKKTVTINTTTTFGADIDNSNGKYRLSYIITENNVGPYIQTNNYAGGRTDYGDAGGWGSLGSSVSTMYNDVARYMDGYPGLANSIPNTIKAQEELTRTHEIKIPSNVSNVANINVVVYLMDNTRNEIVNACRVKGAEIKGNESAINDITVDNSEAPVEYFNLQGVRVENPSHGLYIRRQGTEVKKVIL